MPRKPIVYSNCVIYKIVPRDVTQTNMVYIGHTTNVRSRRNQHKSKCNNTKSKGYNLPLYQIIRSNGGWRNWSLIVIDEYKDCTNGEEARTREREWFDKIACGGLNVSVPSRTNKQWYAETEYYTRNQEVYVQYSRAYYETHKEQKKANMRAYGKRVRALAKAAKSAVSE